MVIKFGEIEDLELVENIKNGERLNESLGELINRHAPLCYSLYDKLSYTIQQSGKSMHEFYGENDFLIWESALDFKPEKEVKFSTWVGNKVRYKCLSLLTRMKKESIFTNINEEEDFPLEENPISEKVDDIFDFLDESGDKNILTIFQKRYKMGLSLKEIAQDMNISYPNCCKLHKKGLKLIKENYE